MRTCPALSCRSRPSGSVRQIACKVLRQIICKVTALSNSTTVPTGLSREQISSRSTNSPGRSTSMCRICKDCWANPQPRAVLAQLSGARVKLERPETEVPGLRARRTEKTQRGSRHQAFRNSNSLTNVMLTPTTDLGAVSPERWSFRQRPTRSRRH
jgi:hypothetical protein